MGEVGEPAGAEVAVAAAKWPRAVAKCMYWAGIAGTVLLTAIYLLVSDRTAWGEFIAIWPPFFWTLGLAPLALLSFERWRWRRWVALPALILLFMLLTVEWRPMLRRGEGAKEAAGGAPRLRLATWNVSAGSGGIGAIGRELAALAPDICFLQETPDGEEAAAWTGATPHFAGWTWLDAGDCGLLSRWPLEAVATPRVGPWSAPQAAWVEPEPGRFILLVNVRLMLPSLVLNPFSAPGREALAADHAARLAQYPALRRFIEGELGRRPGAEAILAGDFNTPGGMASLAPLRPLLSDVWRDAGRGWGATMTAEFPVARIDQVWMTEGLTAVWARVQGMAVSDHRAVAVEVEVEGERGAAR